ncbi:restriction endonuclease subunit S [Mycoplasmopsis pullorum]|uniref:Type I restriction modification DNA specificity domain-containing protein n=1 Tax=Mycoplasmopsis pullorum TaxID=48003 RepID=A0A1L4FSX2_9BACT|nr:restriction endonuclease subunit S [Mycoplasmopsis pullorum]APJ38725.1 hypothetical protein BLA55_03635 [Mycoplasmopsis pullorum]
MKLFEELMEKELASNNSKVVKKKLYEVTIWDKTFTGLSKEKQIKNNVKYEYLFAKDIENLKDENGDIKILTTFPSNFFTSSEKYKNQIYDQEIVAIPGGSSTMHIQYFKGKFITSDNRICQSFDTNVLNTKFIYYFFHSIKDVLFSFYRGSGIQHPYMPGILNIEIPIPPLEIQNKIVEILDKFTEYSAELKAGDEQYKFYRDKLLSHNNLSNDASISGIKSNIAKVKDYIDYIQPTKFIVKSDKYNPEFKTPVLTANQKFILGYTDEKENIFHSSKENPVIIFDDFTTDLKWVDFDFKIKSSAIKILTPKNSNINIKYFYYWLNFIRNSEESSKEHKRHWISVFAEKSFTLPALSVQNKIVKVLDNFESILKDLNIGLPAEEVKRQEQYEYYRDAIFKYLETAKVDMKPANERERETAE